MNAQKSTCIHKGMDAKGLCPVSYLRLKRVENEQKSKCILKGMDAKELCPVSYLKN